MVESGVIEDYTYLWYDVRPHPNFGTVEIRAMDAQTHVEHTLGARGADPGDGQGAGRALRGGQASSPRYPYEMLDENRWLAARHGLDGELVDLPHERLVPTKELARRLYDRLREHAQDLGAGRRARGDRGPASSDGNGAYRQRVVYEANHDFTRSCARSSPQLRP